MEEFVKTNGKCVVPMPIKRTGTHMEIEKMLKNEQTQNGQTLMTQKSEYMQTNKHESTIGTV
jgi:hypothetical protein